MSATLIKLCELSNLDFEGRFLTFVTALVYTWCVHVYIHYSPQLHVFPHCRCTCTYSTHLLH